MGIKAVPHPPYSPDLAPCDFWLFPKLRGCCYETIEDLKAAVTLLYLAILLLISLETTYIIYYYLIRIIIKTVTLSSKTIYDLLHMIPQCNIISDAGVYCIPWQNCELKYIGLTLVRT